MKKIAFLRAAVTVAVVAMRSARWSAAESWPLSAMLKQPA